MQTIGQQFQAARDSKGVTVAEAAQATRIKTQQLEAMEADDFSSIPAATYARGFIKLYAQFLGLDPAPLLDLYSQGNQPTPPPAPAPPKVVEPAPVQEELPSASAEEAPPLVPGKMAPVASETLLPVSGEVRKEPTPKPAGKGQKAGASVWSKLPAVNWKQAGGIGGTVLGVVLLAVLASHCGREDSEDGESMQPLPSDIPGLIAEPDDAYLSPQP